MTLQDIMSLPKATIPGASTLELPADVIGFYADDTWGANDTAKQNHELLDLAMCVDVTDLNDAGKDTHPGPLPAAGAIGPRRVFSVVNTKVQDNSRWLAWNLRVGRVATLTQHKFDGRLPPSLKFQGRTVDLIGTGQTETCDLSALNMVGMLSEGFYRDFTPTEQGFGALQLFEHNNLFGEGDDKRAPGELAGSCRQVIFLADWPQDTEIPLDGWFLSGTASTDSGGYPPPQAPRSWDFESLRGQQFMTVTYHRAGNAETGNGEQKARLAGDNAFNDLTGPTREPTLTITSFSWNGKSDYVPESRDRDRDRERE